MLSFAIRALFLRLCKSFTCAFKLNAFNSFYILISLVSFTIYFLPGSSVACTNKCLQILCSYYFCLNLLIYCLLAISRDMLSLTDLSLSQVAKKLKMICNFLTYDWFHHENSSSSHFDDPCFDIVLAIIIIIFLFIKFSIIQANMRFCNFQLMLLISSKL